MCLVCLVSRDWFFFLSFFFLFSEVEIIRKNRVHPPAERLPRQSTGWSQGKDYYMPAPFYITAWNYCYSKPPGGDQLPTARLEEGFVTKMDWSKCSVDKCKCLRLPLGNLTLHLTSQWLYAVLLARNECGILLNNNTLAFSTFGCQGSR